MPGRPIHPGARPTLLLVEDSPVTRATMKMILEGQGIRVLEAGDARQALEVLASESPQLILQDLILPDIDGLELARLIREQPRGADIPIIALSGFVGRLEQGRLAAAGFDGFLMKPVEPSHLIATLKPYLGSAIDGDERQGAGVHVMVVNDDPVQLKVTCLRLSHSGYVVTGCGEPREALILIKKKKPDLVLSDLVMPGMDGYELCLAIRRDRALAKLPVVLCTAHFVGEADHRLASQVGANQIVPKTSGMDEILAALREARESRLAPPPADDVELRRGEHADRLCQQLERELALNAGLSQRSAIQGAQLALLGGIADALTHHRDAALAVEDALRACIETAELEMAALFTGEPGGGLRLTTAVGLIPQLRRSLQESPELGSLLERVFTGKLPVSIPHDLNAEGAIKALIDGLGLSSLHLVPLIFAGTDSGLLVLGSKQSAQDREDPTAFARAIGAKIVQSLALAHTFDDLRLSRLQAEDQARRLERADRQKDEFLATLGHELRNPLAPLIHAATLLEDPASLQPLLLSRLGEVVNRQVSHMKRLIDDLLDVARLTQGRIRLERKPLDLVIILTNAVETCAPLIRERGHRLETCFPGGPFPMSGDSTRLWQVVNNLLTNAALYTPPGGQISISLEELAGEAVIRVKDSGIGIAPEMQQEIFELFTRGPQCIAGWSGGLGLGLAFCRRLVDLHQGRIGVISTGAGKGSEFTVHLPRALEETASESSWAELRAGA